MRNFSAKTHKTWQIIECDREGVFGMPVSVMVLASHKPWRGMLEEEISVCACWGMFMFKCFILTYIGFGSLRQYQFKIRVKSWHKKKEPEKYTLITDVSVVNKIISTESPPKYS